MQSIHGRKCIRIHISFGLAITYIPDHIYSCSTTTMDAYGSWMGSVGVILIGGLLFVVALQLGELREQRRVGGGHVAGDLGLLDDPHDLLDGLRRRGGVRVLVVGLLPLRYLLWQILQKPRVLLYLRDRDPLNIKSSGMQKLELVKFRGNPSR